MLKKLFSMFTKKDNYNGVKWLLNTPYVNY